MKINPTLDKVIVKKIDFDELYNGSIILVNSSKNDINKYIYEVIEVGPGGLVNKENIEMIVKPGDKVIIPEYIGSEISIDNQLYRILRQKEILAIVE